MTPTFIATVREMAEILDAEGLGRNAEDQAKWEDAARYFMSIAVLYDDPELSPEALLRAARAYKALNRAADAERTHAELKQRYPQSTWAAQAL